MADKAGREAGAPEEKPVPMKLFATWEVEKSTPTCIPRLCTLTLTRLVVLKPLENELQSVVIGVKMQGSKRILRSNEIIMTPNGLLDTELDLSFSLQYPHFLKRDGNKLQVMLQRRKKYKNRTMLGYKTLAVGQINMAQVLQKSVSRELHLYSDLKARSSIVAKVMMLSLSSQTVTHSDETHIKKQGTEVSDDDDAAEDYSSNDDLSDCEPIASEDDRNTWSRKLIRGINKPTFSRQGNIKQKFIALLRRFKVTEEEVLDSEQDQDVGVEEMKPQDIEDLFDELSNLSESEMEMDTISVVSTPKPKLRPFFTGKGSTEILDASREPAKISDESRYDSEGHLDSWPSPDMYSNSLPSGSPLMDARPKSPSSHYSGTTKGESAQGDGGGEKRVSKPREVIAKHDSRGSDEESVSSEPRKVLLEQLNSLVSTSDEALPESLLIIDTNEWQGQLLSQVLEASQYSVISTCAIADVKATISFIVSKIQKFCNSNSRAPMPIKIAIAGGDGYINTVLRPFVEQFSLKSPDWQSYVKFLVIPLGGSSLCRYLSLVDPLYSALFNDNIWKDVFELSDNSNRPAELGDVLDRVCRYLSEAKYVLQLPIAEVMLTCKEKNSEEESSQIFVPFINEVHIGSIDSPGGISASMDLDEVAPGGVSSSPPQGISVDKVKDSHTPPNSPNINNPMAHSSGLPTMLLTTAPTTVLPIIPSPELLELQVDYWTATRPEPGEKLDKLVKKDSKSSLKTTFRSVHIHRLPQQVAPAVEQPLLTLVMVTKEKKQKIMRIGKKSKEVESKSQTIDGINRLICTSKSQNHPLTVSIDGVEWVGVKFFQVSSQWQTHTKYFPVLIFSSLSDQIS